MTKVKIVRLGTDANEDDLRKIVVGRFDAGRVVVQQHPDHAVVTAEAPSHDVAMAMVEALDGTDHSGAVLRAVCTHCGRGMGEFKPQTVLQLPVINV